MTVAQAGVQTGNACWETTKEGLDSDGADEGKNGKFDR